MSKKIRVNFLVDPDLKREFFEMAKANYTDPSKLLRQYMISYVGRYKHSANSTSTK